MDITIPKKEVELVIPSTGVIVTDAELAITLKPSHEFQITLERDRPDFCIIVGEIDLTIYGMSLIEWFNKNFAELNLQIVRMTDEHNALVQVTMELKAFIEDPNVGNSALAELILQLTTEVHNHYNDQSAHSQLFLNLQSQINANHGLIEANAGNIFNLETLVTQHDGDISSLARTINELSADITSIENGHTSLANAISILEVQVTEHYGELVAQVSRIDKLEVKIDNEITPMLDAHALGIEELQVRVTENAEGLTALASWTLELTSEIGTEFYPWKAWEFTKDLEGWFAFGSCSLTHAENSLWIHGSGGAQVNIKDTFNGAEFPIISMIWKRTGSSGSWDGGIWFQCEEIAGWILATHFTSPGEVLNFTHQVIDLTGTDWEGRTIKALAIVFSSDPDAIYAIDSIGIGRRSAVGSYGAIQKITETYVGEHSVSIGDFNDYQAQVAGEFGSIHSELSIIGDDVDGLTSRWMIELDHNGRISGIYMEGNNQRTSMKFVVDQFSMYLPGRGNVKVFEAGTFDGHPALFMAGAIIKDVIRSENFRWGYGGQWRGWKLDPNGTFYAAGIQIKDSSGHEILSSGSGVNWDPLFNDGQFAISVNEHLSPAAISQFFEDGSIDPDQFGTYMESVGIQSAWIGEAVIGTAHIKNLAVDTDNLKLGSVTSFHTTTGRKYDDIREWVCYCLFTIYSYLIPGGSSTSVVEVKIQISISISADYHNQVAGGNLVLKRGDYTGNWENLVVTELARFELPGNIYYDEESNGGRFAQIRGNPAKNVLTFSFIDGLEWAIPIGNKDYYIAVEWYGAEAEVFFADIVCVEYKR